MALQDLTPQLRTRLSRMERAVGWFVFLATALLLAGFGYYIYHTAERKGWFKIKAPFFIYVQSSSGLNLGDKVYMMGFEVGNITKIEPLPPYDKHNVKLTFDMVDPYFRRVWLGGSYVKVNAAGFLDQRLLEVTRGTNGPAICVTQPGVWKTIPELAAIITTETNRWQLYQDLLDENSNLVFGAYEMLTQSNLARMTELQPPSNSLFVYDNQPTYDRIVASWDNRVRRYVNFSPDHDSAWLRAVETPPVSDQLQAMISQVQAALPGVLALTNQLAAVLDNAANATSNLNATIVAAQPLVANFTVISGELREPGGLGVWALGTNASGQIQGALTNLNSLLANTDTNLSALTANLGVTLDNIAGITSNLNAQVQANSNLLWGLSKTVTDADSFVQGLKHHWLLRSAFKTKATNSPPAKSQPPPPAK
jgi:ABC-type transporter Mla subunit MlaD